MPHFILAATITGDPWGRSDDRVEISLPADRAFRRVCLKMLTRIVLSSADRTCAAGGTHPFMMLLETRGGLHPVDRCTGPLRHPFDQACMMQVIYLMIFVYRRFQWHPRRQYLADVRHAKLLEMCGTRAELTRRIMCMVFQCLASYRLSWNKSCGTLL